MTKQKYAHKHKKLAALIFISTIVMVGAIFALVSRPENAQAVGCFSLNGATDAVSGATGGMNAVPVNDSSLIKVSTSIDTSTDKSTNKSCILDGLLKQVAHTLVQSLTNSIIRWINSGFHGSPSFVTNPGQFFTNVADKAIGGYIQGTSLAFVCDPLAKLDLQFAFQLKYGHINPEDEPSCTLSGIVKNMKNFTNGSFKEGGWNGWFKVTQDPSNNEYGSLIVAQASLETNIAALQGVQQKILDWGNGFRSLTDSSGQITTPGSMINSQLQSATGNDLSSLNLAKSFDDIIGALQSALITQAMNQGVTHASGNSGSGSGSVQTQTTFKKIGDSTTAFTISNPTGHVWRYTWVGGTNPAITARTFITTGTNATTIYIQAGNFSPENNGTYSVVGVGSGYFEVLNPDGIAESQKTLGSGNITYLKK